MRWRPPRDGGCKIAERVMDRNRTGVEKREIARKIIAYEATMRAASGNGPVGSNQVIESLLPTLVPLVGQVGFCSLLARALALAQREAPALRNVRVEGNCTLQGFSAEAAQGDEFLIAQIIELLTTFVGERLTIRLLRNVWPELPELKTVPGEHERL